MLFLTHRIIVKSWTLGLCNSLAYKTFKMFYEITRNILCDGAML